MTRNDTDADAEPEWTIEATVELQVEATMPNPEKPDEAYAQNVVEGGYYQQKTTGIADVRIESIERADAPVDDADTLDSLAEDVGIIEDSQTNSEPRMVEPAEPDNPAATNESPAADGGAADATTADAPDELPVSDEAGDTGADETTTPAVWYVNTTGQTLEQTTDYEERPRRGMSVTIDGAYYVIEHVEPVAAADSDTIDHFRVIVS